MMKTTILMTVLLISVSYATTISSSVLYMNGSGVVHYEVNNQTFDWESENGSIEINITSNDSQTNFEIDSENGSVELGLQGEYDLEINQEEVSGNGFFNEIINSIKIFIRGVVRL